MGQSLLSANVVARHYFAKYGYDDSMTIISMQLASTDNTVFWKEVIGDLEKIYSKECNGIYACNRLSQNKFSPEFEVKLS